MHGPVPVHHAKLELEIYHWRDCKFLFWTLLPVGERLVLLDNATFEKADSIIIIIIINIDCFYAALLLSLIK